MGWNHNILIFFQGDIRQISENRYTVHGLIEKLDDTMVEITELPVKTWTQPYKEFLANIRSEKDNKKYGFNILDFEEHHTEARVHFKVELSEENMALVELEGFEKKFKLVTQISTSNMVCFDPQGRIRKYNSINEIMLEFYSLRLEYYYRRKVCVLFQHSN